MQDIFSSQNSKLDQDDLAYLHEFEAECDRQLAIVWDCARCISNDIRCHDTLDAADDVQVPVYELSVAFAELIAARSAIHYSKLAFLEDRPSADVALVFATEILGTTLLNCRSLQAQVHGQVNFDLRFGGVSRAVLRPDKLRLLGAEIVMRGRFRAREFYSDAVQMMRESFARFADNSIAPLAQQIHRENQDIPEQVLTDLSKLGCFGLSVPEEYGGLLTGTREDALGMLVVTEELSRGSLGAAGSLITRPEVIAKALLAGGTENQKTRWLETIASGEVMCAVAITEPGTGSDVAAVSTTATKVDAGWKINGAKMWCTFAGRASLILVLARTDANVSPPHKGLSLFVIEKPAVEGDAFEYESSDGGVLSGQAIATLGYRGMHSFDLQFDDFVVPPENLVGESEGEGRGFYSCMHGFVGGRNQTAARAVGVMQAAYDEAVEYALTRSVFKKPIAEYPLTSRKLVRMLGQLTAARQLSYASVTDTLELPAPIGSAVSKLFACRVAEAVTREAMQIFGGIGYAEETIVSRLFVDARVLSIFEGTEETLALKVIGRYLIEYA